MDFDEGNLHAGKSIANRETRVAVCAGVHQRAIGATTQRVNRFDDFPFSVVLRERELDSKLPGDLQEPRLDVGESLGPVKLRLARAEQIEVRAIDDGDSHSPVSPSSQARNFATSSSDSCACGTRGFTRGVGTGGVAGLVLDVPAAPLKAPARREAARLSAAFTVAPANTASSDALVGAPPGVGAMSEVMLPEVRAFPPELAVALGGRRRPSVAKNSLTDGCRAAIPSGSARGASRWGASTDSR